MDEFYQNNFTSTDNYEFPMDSTDFYFTTDDVDSKEDPTLKPTITRVEPTLKPTTSKEDPPGPADGPEPGSKTGEQPEHHSERLRFKQGLAVSADVIITLGVILALLQIVIYANCWQDFRKTQFNSRSGKVLFTLFIIALILFYSNAIIFTSFIFSFENLSEESYAWTLIFSMVPYRWGKLMMSLFFIFRLHFVFKDSALRISKWIIWSLAILSFAAAILATYSGVGGPLKSIGNAISTSAASLGCTILVDTVVMILYVRALVNVTVMQGKITRKTSMICESTGGKVQQVIELHPKKSYTNSKMQQHVIANQSMDLDALQLGETDSNTLTNGGNGIKHSVDKPTQSETALGDDEEQGEMIKKAYTGIEEVTRTKVHVDKNMIATVTKSTLLSLIGILTSMWLNIEMVVLIAQDETDGVLFRAIGSFDGAMNLICMYLIFSFAKPYYEIGCHFCHLGMEGLCKKFSKKQVLRKNSRSEI